MNTFANDFTSNVDHLDDSVTVVVTQRERFGMTDESLNSLIENTPDTVPIRYVDGGAPRSVGSLLDQWVEKGRISLLRADRFFTPTMARALGAAEVQSDYIAFVDNDVIFAEGWLEGLLACAKQESAAAVAPLTCQGYPPHTVIHHAGGHCLKPPNHDDAPSAMRLEDAMYHQGAQVSEMRSRLEPVETNHFEFHCVLIDRRWLVKAGGFDLNMLSTKEHVDLALCLQRVGGRIWFTPESLVTYVFPCRQRPLTWQELPFLLARWSGRRGYSSLVHLNEKHQLNLSRLFIAKKRWTYATRRSQALGQLISRRLKRIVDLIPRKVFVGLVRVIELPLSPILTKLSVRPITRDTPVLIYSPGELTSPRQVVASDLISNFDDVEKALL